MGVVEDGDCVRGLEEVGPIKALDLIETAAHPGDGAPVGGGEAGGAEAHAVGAMGSLKVEDAAADVALPVGTGGRVVGFEGALGEDGATAFVQVDVFDVGGAEVDTESGGHVRWRVYRHGFANRKPGGAVAIENVIKEFLKCEP